jgi:hypothetical protein
MAGVAGPMLGRSKPQGVRFLSGLLFGGLLASALLATALYILGTLVSLVVPLAAREIATVVIVLALGAADLVNRTPHVWRQVPQALVRRLPPGRLGVIWGFDLSLLFTTQKSTSLTWAAVAAVGLLFPTQSWLVLLTLTAVGALSIVLRSVMWSVRSPSLRGDRGKPWFRVARQAAGVSLLGMAVITAVGAWYS